MMYYTEVIAESIQVTLLSLVLVPNRAAALSGFIKFTLPHALRVKLMDLPWDPLMK